MSIEQKPLPLGLRLQHRYPKIMRSPTAALFSPPECPDRHSPEPARQIEQGTESSSPDSGLVVDEALCDFWCRGRPSVLVDATRIWLVDPRVCPNPRSAGLVCEWGLAVEALRI